MKFNFRLSHKLILISAIVIISACSESSKAPSQIPAASVTADIIFINTNVYTLDWDEPALDGAPAANAPFNNHQWQADAEAIAIKDGKILYVGEQSEALKLKADNTRVINLDNATIIPGLVDSHVHVAELGELLQSINLTDITSPEEVITHIKSSTTGIADDQWIIGQGWDEGAWANNYPNRQMLDNAFPNNPVYLRSQGWLKTPMERVVFC